MIDRIENIGKRYVHYLTELHEVSIEGLRGPMSSDLMKKFKEISGNITVMQKDIVDFSTYFLKAFPRLDIPKPKIQGTPNGDTQKEVQENPSDVKGLVI